MKNEKILLASEWDSAPDVNTEPFSKYYYTDYRGKKQCRKSKNYIYKCRVIGTGVLLLTIFTADKKPLFRSFVSGENFKSQYADDGKPSDSTLLRYQCDVLRLSTYYENGKMETDESSRRNVERWLGENALAPLKSNETPISAVEDVQADIRKRAIQRKNDRIRKSIDDNMLDIRPVPARIKKWVDDVVLKDSRYILYEYTGRKLQPGNCTHCGEDVMVEGARHGKTGKCPKCKSEVKFITKGRAKDGFSDDAKYAYIQPDKNGEPIFRYFEVRRYFELRGNAYHWHEYTSEEHRYFYGKNKKYSWDNFRQTGEYRFCDSYSIPGRWGNIYPYNLKTVFKNAAEIYPHIKYIPITRMLNSMQWDINPHYFYVNMCERPIIEYLAKFKLNRLCGATINGFTQNDYFDATAEKFKDVFPRGVTRDELRFFAKLDMTPRELEMYYQSRGIKRDRFEKALALERDDVIRESCFKYLKYTTPEKLLKYLTSMPKRNYWNDSTFYKSGDWADYIETAEKLKWDMKNDMVLFPRDFWEAHDRANALAKVENAKRLDKAVAKRKKLLDEAYRMEGKEYFIRAAVNAREIVKEGQALHHCVGTYAEKVANGETGILFMRSVKEPDKPLYTIEVKNGVVMQCRGKNNRAMDKKKEKTFFDRWKKAKFKEDTRKAG